MKNQVLLSRKTITILFFIVALTGIGCKKDKPAEIKLPTIVGAWANVGAPGSYRTIVNNIEFKADGSGNEYIYSVTTSSTTDISDLNFKWTVENDNRVTLKFEDGNVEKFNYVIREAESLFLTMTSESGKSMEYYNTDND